MIKTDVYFFGYSGIVVEQCELCLPIVVTHATTIGSKRGISERECIDRSLLALYLSLLKKEKPSPMIQSASQPIRNVWVLVLIAGETPMIRDNVQVPLHIPPDPCHGDF